MISKVTNPELKQGLQSHLHETQQHVSRPRAGFQDAQYEASSVTCPAIDGILEEADEVSSEVADKNVLDAAIIASGQAVEHYEITRYGSLIAWAKEMGRKDVADLLTSTLDEEKAADKKLTMVAEQRVNKMADKSRAM